MLTDHIHNYEGKITVRTGACRFCGQLKSVEAPEEWDDGKLDELVAENCNCDESHSYQFKKRRKEKVDDAIGKLVRAEEVEGKVPQEALYLLHAASEPVCNEVIKAVTIETGNEMKIKINVTAKGSIKVECKEIKKKNERNIGGKRMFEQFGEFDSAAELNKTAMGLRNEGDIESLKKLAEENGIDVEDAEDYADGAFDEFTTVKEAALGKIEVECRELKPKEIIEDWINYIKTECMDSDEMAKAVRKKGKSLKSCIAKILVWSFKNSYEVDKQILKEANISQHCKMGIPGMGRAKEMIRSYYLD